ncbi:hypothetical protein F3Y22_tig00112230pilonHSYRG00120 [Hibiscus syriacus]|uniref:Uncharacterized protein n=1 Tax=Hibiscus syriacus TaxID=106335 RepID=A0A6A2YCR6_HIBSY|nr:hypothetical protein F3Y22_tig00112230pilonHSYRG00120 [Hibiscus syriacus]
MQEEMRSKLTQMKASIKNSHLDLLNKVEEMVRGHLTTGKTTMEDPTNPPGFTPIHIPEHTSRRQKIRSPVSFTIENPQYQVGVSFPIDFPTASGLKPGERCNNMEVQSTRLRKIQRDHLPIGPPHHVLQDNNRQYTQRWCDVASQVQPPLLKKEATIIYVNTLKAPYLGHLVGNATKNFFDLTNYGELIENAIRNGKIGGSDSADVPIGEIPVTYEELLSVLVEKNLVTPIRSKPKEPPFPEGHDANAVCSYHMGSPRHTTENCGVLKCKVQHLIDLGAWTFE